MALLASPGNILLSDMYRFEQASCPPVGYPPHVAIRGDFRMSRPTFPLIGLIGVAELPTGPPLCLESTP